MGKNAGYKAMIRDRVPKMVNLALKYCKCKEKWIDHVYKNWVWIYKDEKERDMATRKVLGLDKHGKPTKFKFEGTILWDNFSKEEEAYWKRVSKWVSWFQTNYSYVENEYSISKAKGRDIREIKYDLMVRYLDWMCPNAEDTQEERKKKNVIINGFVDYLIECFDNA